MSSTRLAAMAAFALVLAGALGTVWLPTTQEYAADVFASVELHAPTKRFRNLQCPATLAIDQTAQISVEIANPEADDLVYQVVMRAPDFTVIEAPEPETTISGDGSTRTAWLVKPLAAGHHAVTISALSEADLAAPDAYRAWTRSFQETCFVDVGAVPGLSQGRIVLLSGILTILSTLVGLVSGGVWVYRKWKLSGT